MDVEREEWAVKSVKDRGETPVLFTKDGKLCLLLGISDRIRNNTKETIKCLKKKSAGQMIMLTGDHEQAARNVSKELLLDAFYLLIY